MRHRAGAAGSRGGDHDGVECVRVQTVPLYSEQYRLLTSSDSPLGNRDAVTWAEVGKVPLCLLTPDMQNRRIIEQLLRQAGAKVAPTLESNSIVVLFAHVRTGKWASVMPAKLAEGLGLTEKVRAIPIVEPEVTHSIGLVVPHRNPLTPLIHALVREAKELAPILGASASAPERTRRPTAEDDRRAAVRTAHPAAAARQHRQWPPRPPARHSHARERQPASHS